MVINFWIYLDADIHFCLLNKIISILKFSDAGIQDISTSISIIMVKFEEMSNQDDDDDESDKHLESTRS